MVPPWPMAEIEKAVEESRAKQGLPPRITDPEILRKVATIVRLAEKSA
jgi:hypothetical protein